jgi:hypothetical protein
MAGEMTSAAFRAAASLTIASAGVSVRCSSTKSRATSGERLKVVKQFAACQWLANVNEHTPRQN